MPQLTTAQFARLQAALLDAFDPAELAQMVRLELDQNLDHVAGGGTLTEVVFNLVQWAQRQGRVRELARAAHRQRPHNPALAALAQELESAPDEPPPSPAPAGPTMPAAAPGGFTIGKIEAVNVGEAQFIDQRGATFNLGDRAEVHTGGGAYVGGDVHVQSGDFVGRDKIVHGDEVHGDKVGGDKVGGDKISAGDIAGTGIAIGRDASASVQQGVDGEQLIKALAPLIDAVQRSQAGAAAQAAATQQIQELTQELAKGKGADDSRVAGILDDLAKLVPGAVGAVVSAFGTPLLAGLAGPITQFVLDRLRRGRP